MRDVLPVHLGIVLVRPLLCDIDQVKYEAQFWKKAWYLLLGPLWNCSTCSIVISKNIDSSTPTKEAVYRDINFKISSVIAWWIAYSSSITVLSTSKQTASAWRNKILAASLADDSNRWLNAFSVPKRQTTRLVYSNEYMVRTIKWAAIVFPFDDMVDRI